MPDSLSRRQIVPFLLSVIASGERLTAEEIAEIRALDAGPRSEEAGLDVNRVRRAILDDIGEALSRELAQGDPFESFDRLRVAKTITRVLDEARDRIRVAEGAVR